MGLTSLKICCAGLRRPVNQDRAINLVYADCGLFLVADGMGGHFAGERASQALMDYYANWWVRVSGTVAAMDFSAIVEELQCVLSKCNEEIFRNTPAGKICGSTLILLFLQKEKYALLSVGDSRCYRVTAGILPMVRQISVDDVSPRPQDKQKLTQAVGCREHCTGRLQTGKAAEGTVFALCSDGIYKYCPSSSWKRCLSHAFRTGKLDKAMERISGCVQDHGAEDNYSLVLVRV